jgi:hypothetical protein
MSPRTWASSPAASLLAQPAQLTISVSRFAPEVLMFSSWWVGFERRRAKVSRRQPGIYRNFGAPLPRRATQ